MDIKLVGYQYNIGLTLFYLAYIAVEIFSNLALKRFGASIWLPMLVFFFGLITFATSFIKDFAGFATIRVLLGFSEGGVMPGIAYLFSTLYTRDELVFRVGVFVAMSSLSGESSIMNRGKYTI